MTPTPVGAEVQVTASSSYVDGRLHRFSVPARRHKVRRAPRWMQKTGLEWAHRLGTEPGRLAGRYLKHDAPYAVRLLAGAATGRHDSIR